MPIQNVLITALAMAFAPGAVMADEPDAAKVVVTRSGTQPAAAGPEANFTGAVRVESRFQAEAPGRAGGGLVTFEPGARTAWHSHPLGQTLIVTSGVGWVGQWGGAVQEMRPGDIVRIPPGVKHWHGASPSTGMSHIAIAEALDGETTEWMEKVGDTQYQLAPSRPAPLNQPAAGALSPRQQTMPLIAAFMATGDMPRLNAALNQGLDAGMTVSEAKEILVQLYAYAGFPRSLNALAELMKVVEGRKLRGIQDAPGREPARAIPSGAALQATGKDNQTKISGAPVAGPVFDFAPVINQYLQSHLFGDIFERDNLDWQSRELATVGALAAMPGVEAQLRSHMRASLRVGLSAAQLHELVETLAARADAQAAERARSALREALATTPGDKK